MSWLRPRHSQGVFWTAPLINPQEGHSGYAGSIPATSTQHRTGRPRCSYKAASHILHLFPDWCRGWRTIYWKRVIVMSDDNFDIFEGEDDAELPKKLRAKIKELQKERDELAEKFSAFEEKERKTSLQSALEGMGYNPKIASFIPKEVTEQEQLHEWLNEFGDVFGGGGQTAAVPNPQQAEINRMNAVQQQGTQAPPADIMARIDQAQNMDELMSALGQHS